MKLTKRILNALLLIVVVFLLSNCDEDFHDHYVDDVPPSPPSNVKIFTGDGEVEISWDENPESDVRGYNVYYANGYWDKYTLIGNTYNNYFVDVDAENGDKYFYGVAAYDRDNNESELSYDKVYGIARPEGFNELISDFRVFPENSGFDFDEFTVGPYDEVSDQFSADVFYDNDGGVLYLNVWSDSDIIDLGLTNDIYDILEAPLDGYVPLVDPNDNIKYTQALRGHTYVIRTWDNHYAKMRISSLNSEKIIFDWAYQLLSGELMLKQSTGEVRNIEMNQVNVNR